jgi:hypothetical protein
MKRTFYTAQRRRGGETRKRNRGTEASAMAEHEQTADVRVNEMAERASTSTMNEQVGALFGPGVAQPGVRGLAGREGMPRQWAYGASINVAQRPRGTEQTSFEQLRNLAALHDGIQLSASACILT